MSNYIIIVYFLVSQQLQWFDTQVTNSSNCKEKKYLKLEIKKDKHLSSVDMGMYFIQYYKLNDSVKNFLTKFNVPFNSLPCFYHFMFQFHM